MKLPVPGAILATTPAQIGGTLPAQQGAAGNTEGKTGDTSVPVTTQGVRSLDGTARFHKTLALTIYEARSSTRLGQVNV